MKHILLRAPSGAGKSTMIQRLAEEAGLPVYGFLTKKEATDQDGISRTYLHPARETREEWTRSEANRIGTSDAAGIRETNPDVFDTTGVRLISEAEKGGVLIMDELGVMEKDAAAFQKKVLEALEGDILVIAAVKAKSHPFLEKVISHPDGELIDFTRETREDAYEKAREILASYLNETKKSLL